MTSRDKSMPTKQKLIKLIASSASQARANYPGDERSLVSKAQTIRSYCPLTKASAFEVVCCRRSARLSARFRRMRANREQVAISNVQSAASFGPLPGMPETQWSPEIASCFCPLPTTTASSRRVVSPAAWQVLARGHQYKQHILVANISQIAIVSSTSEPPLKPALIDRFIVSCCEGRCPRDHRSQ